jgi:predicted RNase H-like nuclease (RuvC/YqgF family)
MTVGGIILDGIDVVTLGLPGYVWAAIGAAVFMGAIIVAVVRQHQSFEMITAGSDIVQEDPTDQHHGTDSQPLKAEIESLIKRNEELDVKIMELEDKSSKVENYPFSTDLRNSAQRMRQDKKNNEARIDELTRRLNGDV